MQTRHKAKGSVSGARSKLSVMMKLFSLTVQCGGHLLCVWLLSTWSVAGVIKTLDF